MRSRRLSFFFFFNDTATTEIYTLSLHDALPILAVAELVRGLVIRAGTGVLRMEGRQRLGRRGGHARSEEHTSELQSQSNLVCRLLLEKKKKILTRTPAMDHTLNNVMTESHGLSA